MIRNQKTRAIRTNGRKPARSCTEGFTSMVFGHGARAESLDRGSSVRGVTASSDQARALVRTRDPTATIPAVGSGGVGVLEQRLVAAERRAGRHRQPQVA